MKAKIKATGEVVELYDWCEVTEMDSYKNFTIEQLEFTSDDTNYTHDYWEKLLHQYAGMAMQGLCANYTEFTKVNDGTVTNREMIVENARLIAHALVEELKGKEERK